MVNEIIASLALLKQSDVTLLDAARLMRNVLDSFPKNSCLSPVQFCAKVIETGLRHVRHDEMSVAEGFSLYLELKRGLRKDSLRDIRYLGARLLRSNSEFASANFSEIKAAECEVCLNSTFKTPSQFNKARTMLYGLFEFAVRREWCEQNPIKLVQKHKVVEAEIKPLSLERIKRIFNATQPPRLSTCLPAVAILALAGMRPREVCQLSWSDIDLEENSIRVRSICSKTGGVRHVEIPPSLKRILSGHRPDADSAVCPKNWRKKWKEIRDSAGFEHLWVRDVLRHTYASFHAKFFRDLPRLQLNMGHSNLELLRSRYINMNGIGNSDAKEFFERIGTDLVPLEI